MRIIDLQLDNQLAVQQVAAMLVAGFKDHWPDAWPELDDALEEVAAMAQPDRISRIAVDDAGTVLGWIGGISGYDGNVWELHPLAVQPGLHGKGIGRALVLAFEVQVRQRGGLTVTLGSDDQDNMTSLSGIDLYENLWDKVRNIQNLKGHPYEFYQKMGYVITGVVPDANGLGRPDIFMSKRVAR